MTRTAVIIYSPSPGEFKVLKPLFQSRPEDDSLRKQWKNIINKHLESLDLDIIADTKITGDYWKDPTGEYWFTELERS